MKKDSFVINNAYVIGTDIVSGFTLEKACMGTWRMTKVKYRKAKPYKQREDEP